MVMVRNHLSTRRRPQQTRHPIQASPLMHFILLMLIWGRVVASGEYGTAFASASIHFPRRRHLPLLVNNIQYAVVREGGQMRGYGK